MARSQLFHENYCCKIPCPHVCAAQGHLWDFSNDRATLEEALSCWLCIWWSLLKRVWANSRLLKVAGGENQMQGLPTPERSTSAGENYVISLLIGHVGGVLGTCQNEDGVLRSHVSCLQPCPFHKREVCLFGRMVGCCLKQCSPERAGKLNP